MKIDSKSQTRIGLPAAPVCQNFTGSPRLWRTVAFGTVFLSAALGVLSTLANWTDGKAALSVLGQSDFAAVDENRGGAGPTAATLNRPQGIAFDPATGKLFVCDTTNQRILRYASAAALTTDADAEAVFGQADFTSANAGNGRAQLSSPAGVAVDSAGRLWVADNINHRVVMFEEASTKPSGADADGLLGVATFATNSSGAGAGQMYQPQDVATDDAGTLWVADWQNNRVLRFDDAAASAKANALNAASNTAPADGVLGQGGFGTNDINRGSGTDSPVRNGMDRPWKLTADAAGNLWVCDAFNNRILYFENAAAKLNGADADGLIGSNDFVTETAVGGGQTRFWGPRGITLDSTGSLWVTEEFNRRAVRFSNAAAAALANAADLLQNTALPDVVLGQPDFVTNAIPNPRTAALMTAGWDVCASPYGNLWVVDFRDSRVLRFKADASSYQGDGMVGEKRSNLKGNDRYNNSGSGQKVTAKTENRKKLKFYVTVQNDGTYQDDFTVLGTKKNRYFRIKYFQLTGGKKNVTSQLTKGTHELNEVASGGETQYRVEVKPKRSTVGRNKSRTIKVTATSACGGAKDRVKIKAKAVK